MKLQTLLGYSTDQVANFIRDNIPAGLQDDGLIQRFEMPLDDLFPTKPRPQHINIDDVLDCINTGFRNVGFEEMNHDSQDRDTRDVAEVSLRIKNDTELCYIKANNLQALLQRFDDVANHAREAAKRMDLGLSSQDQGWVR